MCIYVSTGTAIKIYYHTCTGNIPGDIDTKRIVGTSKASSSSIWYTRDVFSL